MRKISWPSEIPRTLAGLPRNTFRTTLVAITALGFAWALTSPPTSHADGAGHPHPAQPVNPSGPRLTYDVRGTVPTQDGKRLRMAIDLGNVVVKTDDNGKIDYTVHLEADASQKEARRLLKDFVISARPVADGVYFRGQTSERKASGRLWVTITVNVPRNYNLDVSTGGGNISIEDLNGRATLATVGGNVVAGNTSGAARFTTQGGHITMKNVGADLYASTGGGHITTGTIAGTATLRTEGGHIQVSSINGTAHLWTAGGNVSVGHSGADLFAETVGGQIDVGEASGLVHAKTSGGGIHVARMNGPSNLEATEGSIYLTQVDGAVKASTGAGAITAWFVTQPSQSGQPSQSKSPNTCEFDSGVGDIVVYIPKQLAVTIDAQMPSDEGHHLFVDPSLRLLVRRDSPETSGATLHAVALSNGGGEVVHLRTISGNIRLLASDAAKQLELYRNQMQQLEESLELQLRQMDRSETASKRLP